MSELTTKRTLVKSPPELWAEVSDLEALTKHLGEFGEIRITRLEPETTVVWEGERASGTVRLEPSGWGTKVTLTAELAALEEPPAAEAEPPAAEAEPPAEPEPLPEPVAIEAPLPSPIEEEPAAQESAVEEPAAQEPVLVAEPAPARKPGFWARLFGRKKALAEVPPPEQPHTLPPVAEPEPEPEPVEEPPAPEPPPLQPLPDPEPEPEPDEPLPAAEEPAAQLDDNRAVAVLTEALDNLGAAHHRPFSRG